MKFVIVLFALVAVAVAAPQGLTSSKDAQILEYTNDNIGIGGYSFSYKTSDGVSRTEQAVVKNQGQENEFLEVTGTVTWKGLDGKDYTYSYVANDQGTAIRDSRLPVRK